MSINFKSFYPLVEKFESFGWEVDTVDGHNSNEICDKFNNRIGDRPYVMICKTIKGKGVSYMENIPMWHYRSPNPEEYIQAIKELDQSDA